MDLTGTLDRVLAEYPEICDHCLGRLFGKRSFGLSNAGRGHGLRVAHAIWADTPFIAPHGSCPVCGDLFDDQALWVARMAEASGGIEFQTFLVGCRLSPIMTEAEEVLWTDYALTGPEPIKSEVNREMGKAFGTISGKVADLAHPDLVFILNIPEEVVEVRVTPIFLYGRYQKFERGIPQTHWDCRHCRGAGCEICGFSGKQYQDSVEELIGRPVVDALGADGAILHGAGREDIDARMIGSGRPFILEVIAPRVRTVDFSSMSDLVNRSAEGRVSVMLSRFSRRDEVETLKSDKGHKKYRILVEIDSTLTPDDLRKAISSLEMATIYQRTPHRVAHRRADKVRERRVVAIAYAGEENDRHWLDVTGEAGLYIKELISGDSGRTHPSLSEILGCPARVITLDVVQVQGRLDGE